MSSHEKKNAVNGPCYSCLLSCLAFEGKWGWCWPCFNRNFPGFLMLMMLFSCKLLGIYKRKKVRCLSKQGQHQPHFHSKGQANMYKTVKWSVSNDLISFCLWFLSSLQVTSASFRRTGSFQRWQRSSCSFRTSPIKLTPRLTHKSWCVMYFGTINMGYVRPRGVAWDFEGVRTRRMYV